MGTARSWRGIVGFTHLAREGRMTVTIGRRELLVALGGGAAAAWPLAARGQQERMRRIGMLSPFSENDFQSRARLSAFHQGLQKLGWTEGSNLRIDARWFGGGTDDNRKNAAELIAGPRRHPRLRQRDCSTVTAGDQDRADRVCD